MADKKTSKPVWKTLLTIIILIGMFVVGIYVGNRYAYHTSDCVKVSGSDAEKILYNYKSRDIAPRPVVKPSGIKHANVAKKNNSIMQKPLAPGKRAAKPKNVIYVIEETIVPCSY